MSGFNKSIALLALTISHLAAGEPVTNAALPDLRTYESVLQKHVHNDGKVNYTGLKADLAMLDAFVRQIGAVSPDSDPNLFPTRESRLAYWLNAYNALVLQRFAADYPQHRNRLNTLPGRGAFFFLIKHKVGGKMRTLDDIESTSIRKAFKEPRIHFAVVCASASCPWLSRKPYTAENLEAQLEAETKLFFSQARNFQMDEKKREVMLPRIFDWFKGDFGGSPEKILAFVARYRSQDAAKLTSGDWRIRYFEYEWAPNDTR
jgi:hypothetical protein